MAFAKMRKWTWTGVFIYILAGLVGGYLVGMAVAAVAVVLVTLIIFLLGIVLFIVLALLFGPGADSVANSLLAPLFGPMTWCSILVSAHGFELDRAVGIVFAVVLAVVLPKMYIMGELD